MIDLFDLPYLAEMPSPKSLFHFGKLAAKFGADKLRRYPRGTRLTMGNALAARLLAAALDAGVTLRNGVSAEHMLVEGKRVVGIQAGGEELRGGSGVELAAGGFGAAERRAGVEGFTSIEVRRTQYSEKN